MVDVNNGWSFRTVVFKDIAGGSFDLRTVKVKKNTGADYNTTGISSLKANGFTVQKISTAGAYLDEYHYITCVSGTGAVAEEGWYKDGKDLVTEPIALNHGEGVIIHTTKSDAALLMCGEVDFVCQTSVPNGWSFSGNSTPVAFNLSDVQVKKNTGDDYNTTGISSLKANGFTIQKISAAGAYLDEYHYITCVSGTGAVAQKGWYKNGTELVTSENDLSFEPGEGFIIHTTKSDAMLVLPKPITE